VCNSYYKLEKKDMKITRSKLRSIIREVMKDIEEDALFPKRDVLGLEPERDIPGQTAAPMCKGCMKHHSGDCQDHSDETGRNLSYGHVKSDDREGRMTRGHLYKISKYSQSLHDMLRDEDDLPEWVQSKVARAADKMESVYGYMEYKLSKMKH
jgi:hypothetical protein